MKSRTSASLFFAAAIFLFAADTEISRLREDLQFLTSAKLKGRATGALELRLAADYIAQQFGRAGLQPLGPGRRYSQEFPVSISSQLTSAALSFTAGRDTRTLTPNEDFIPLSFSGSGKLSAPLVFAGYGITALDCDYDDYAGIDTAGKIVVLLRHEPQEYEAASAFEGKVYSEHSQLWRKAVNAKAHGAIAVLYVNDTSAHSGPDALDKFSSLPGPADPGFPFVQVKAEFVERWFANAGKDFKSIQERIDNTGRPSSFEFPTHLRVEMSIQVRHEQAPAFNVIGFVAGRTDEYVVVGAHYDHLGGGEQYSLAPNMTGTVHPGADDNASGVSGLLALARRFGTQQPRSERGVLFLAFAGEELGLLGSSYYVNNPSLDLGKAVGMINMDMIGRVRDKKVIVGGAATATGLDEAVAGVSKSYGFQLDMDEQAVYGSSDHTSFKAHRIPVLFFFTGLHADYHRPSDTWDKIDLKQTARLVQMIGDVTAHLANAPARLPFIARPAGPIGTPPAAATSGGSEAENKNPLTP